MEHKKWPTQELESTVIEYIKMLNMQQKGESFVKLDCYRSLSQKFGRQTSAYEKRMQNISHILSTLEKPWLKGLKPLDHIGANVEPVLRYLLAEHTIACEANLDTNKNFWLLLEKSDETLVSNSRDSYNDITGKIYNYDSNVANHLRLSSHDIAFIRKENTLVGYGVVGEIIQRPGEKILRRCPSCSDTDIRTRTTRLPKWKCGQCKYEFTNPTGTVCSVILYSAAIESFTKISNPPGINNVKECSDYSQGSKIQNAIFLLNKNKISNLLNLGF